MDPWLARCSARGTDRSMARLWALRGTLLFDDVDGELLEALAVRAGEVEVVPGEVVVAEGTPGDALFVVISGAVAVERDCALVAELGPGQAFGELALLDGLPRQATVRSTRSTRLLRLPRDTFDSALAENPEIGLGLVRGLVRWLRQGDDPRHGTRRPESDTITL
jgi:CRP-like cAMP-binding protein